MFVAVISKREKKMLVKNQTDTLTSMKGLIELYKNRTAEKHNNYKMREQGLRQNKQEDQAHY